LNWEAASGFGRKEIYMPARLQAMIVWRTLSQIFAEEGRERRDEAEIGGKSRAGGRGCRCIKETRTSTRKVVILFDGMGGRGGAWRPAVLVGRISDEDRAALIMTLKMDIDSGCCELGSSGNGDPHSGVLRIERVYQQKLRYNNRGFCRRFLRIY
jgi:hypothetical protein